MPEVLNLFYLVLGPEQWLPGDRYDPEDRAGTKKTGWAGEGIFQPQGGVTAVGGAVPGKQSCLRQEAPGGAGGNHRQTPCTGHDGVGHWRLREDNRTYGCESQKKTLQFNNLNNFRVLEFDLMPAAPVLTLCAFS
jgi:hypothetical protein